MPSWSEQSPDAHSKPSNVAIEEAQHFEKIVVKSVFESKDFDEVWFRCNRRRDIINEVAVEYRWGRGEGMDSKGLDICNNLEQDKACWRGCCRDGRKAACHNGLDSLTGALRAQAQFIQLYCDKTGRGTVEAQTGSAEYLVASAIMSKARRDNTLLKHSAHSLV